MSDFFDTIVARSSGAERFIAPRRPALFEPDERPVPAAFDSESALGLDPSHDSAPTLPGGHPQPDAREGSTDHPERTPAPGTGLKPERTAERAHAVGPQLDPGGLEMWQEDSRISRIEASLQVDHPPPSAARAAPKGRAPRPSLTAVSPPEAEVAPHQQALDADGPDVRNAPESRRGGSNVIRPDRTSQADPSLSSGPANHADTPVPSAREISQSTAPRASQGSLWDASRSRKVASRRQASPEQHFSQPRQTGTDSIARETKADGPDNRDKRPATTLDAAELPKPLRFGRTEPVTRLAQIRPALAPEAETHAASRIDAAAPAIHVTIGRVEVRAPAPPPREPRRATPNPAVLPLNEYLRRRSGGT